MHTFDHKVTHWHRSQLIYCLIIRWVKESSKPLIHHKSRGTWAIESACIKRESSEIDFMVIFAVKWWSVTRFCFTYRSVSHLILYASHWSVCSQPMGFIQCPVCSQEFTLWCDIFRKVTNWILSFPHCVCGCVCVLLCFSLLALMHLYFPSMLINLLSSCVWHTTS